VPLTIPFKKPRYFEGITKLKLKDGNLWVRYLAKGMELRNPGGPTEHSLALDATVLAKPGKSAPLKPR